MKTLLQFFKALALFSTCIFLPGLSNTHAQPYHVLSTLGSDTTGGFHYRWGINGFAGITFNIKAYGQDVLIHRFWTEMNSSLNQFQILYKIDSISSAPNTSTQTWVVIGTSPSFSSTGPYQAYMDTIPMDLNIQIPAGKTYGFWISSLAGGLFYLAPASYDTTLRYDGNIHVNMGSGAGYGGGVPSATINPRQFVGKVEYSLTGSPVSIPQITSVIIQDKRITINWIQDPANNVLRYLIYRDVAANASIIIDSVQSGTFSYSDSNIVNNSLYYYRVVALSTLNIKGQFSNEKRAVALNKPELVSPQNNQLDVAKNVMLKWTRNNFATNYRLQVCKDTFFTAQLVKDTSLADTTKQVTLLYNTTYFWRVKAADSLGSSNWSSTNKFQTTMNTGLNEASETGDANILIFPNPSNNSITIESKSGAITELLIFDMFGKEVIHTNNHSLKPDGYRVDEKSVSLDIGGLNAGLYLSLVKTSVGTCLRKLEILR